MSKSLSWEEEIAGAWKGSHADVSYLLARVEELGRENERLREELARFDWDTGAREALQTNEEMEPSEAHSHSQESLEC